MKNIFKKPNTEKKKAVKDHLGIRLHTFSSVSFQIKGFFFCPDR